MYIHFSYGSNMDTEAMRLRCPNGRPLGRARLRGWEFFIARSGYASLRRRRRAVAHGVLWRLDRSDLAALDLYEDVAGGLYSKTWLCVETPSGRMPAMVYLTRDRRSGRPQPGYIEGVIAAARSWRCPRPAVRHLESWLPGPCRQR